MFTGLKIEIILLL